MLGFKLADCNCMLVNGFRPSNEFVTKVKLDVMVLDFNGYIKGSCKVTISCLDHRMWCE